MSAPSALATPVRVEIKMRDGWAYVTSRFQAGGFYVTPYTGLAQTQAEVEAIDRRATRFDLYVVTHLASGMRVPLCRWNVDAQRYEQGSVSMPIVLARLYATQLAKGQPVVVVDDVLKWAVVKAVAREKSDAALAEFAKLQRRGPRAKKAG